MTTGTRRLPLLRAFFATLALGVFVLSRGGVRAPEFGASERVVAALLGFSILVNPLYAILPMRRTRPEVWLSMQLLCDALVEAAVLYLTGGIWSLFVPVCFATVVAAGLLLSRAMAVILASILVISQAGITFTYYRKHMTGMPLPLVEKNYFQGQTEAFYQGYFLLQSFAYYATALAGARLARGLRRAQGLTDAVLENLDEGVLAVDPQGWIVFANPRSRRMLDLEEAPVAPILLPARLGELGAGREAGLPESWDAPWRSRHPLRLGSAGVPVEVEILPLSASAGRGAVVVLRDLSLRHRMEEAMLRADRLESAGEMAAGIAHEVRNPLASIRGCAQELMGDERGEDARRMLQIVLKECDRLNGLVSGVLDFARHRSLRSAWAAPARILEEMRLQILRTPEWKEAEIVLDADPALRIRCDGDMLRQACWNLVLNALQAYDGPPRRVTLRLRRVEEPLFARPGEGEWIRLDVVDQGRGIAPEVRRELFRPFYSTRAGGSGLGLALVQRVIASHGGDITVDSRLGEGATFSLWLPVEGAPEAVVPPGEGP
ncbi:MAG: PAS domain-containing protein [Planctomycetes bacterium]|nr:PAS domain-containing protein [Planctomycetota bacterium]